MTLVQRRADKVIVNEVRSTYAKLPITRGATVLDLGANIGASARLFLEKGAGKVVAIEPDPTSVILLRRNLARLPAEVYWAAVGRKAGQTNVYVSRTKPYLSSLFPDTGRVAVRVPVFPFDGLLARYQPAVVKCDIEFGEYDLDWTLPDCVRVVALEIHVRYDLVFATRRQTDDELRAQRKAGAAIVATLEGQGFTLVQRSDKLGKGQAIEDDTGFDPLIRSVDAIWSR